MYLLSELAKVPLVKMNTPTRIWRQEQFCVKPLNPGQWGAVGHVELGQLKDEFASSHLENIDIMVVMNELFWAL